MMTMTDAIDLEAIKERIDQDDYPPSDRRALIAEVERFQARDASATRYSFGRGYYIHATAPEGPWSVTHDWRAIGAFLVGRLNGLSKDDAIALAQRLAAEESSK